MRRFAATVVFALGLPMATPLEAQGSPPGTDIYLVSMQLRNGTMSVGPPINVTDREGYDNQPSFLPDGSGFLYTSYRGTQSDTYRYDIAGRAITQITHTSPESEYSPTVTPRGNAFTVVRVETDSTQRLWQFSLDGTNPSIVLREVEPVGYQAWGDDRTVALFILGSPPTLQLADLRTGRAEILARNIGRSMHKVPGRHAISFVHQVSESERWIREVDLDSRAVRPLVQLLDGNEFYAWAPDGTILMGQESRLYRWDPEGDRAWSLVADLAEAGIHDISRLAVSGNGECLAIVSARPADEPAE